MSVGEEAPPTDISIPPPDFKIQQLSAESKFELSFANPTSKQHNATSIQVQYRPLSNLHANQPKNSKEVTDIDKDVEEVNTDGKSTVVLRNGLKPVSPWIHRSYLYSILG